MKLYKKGYGLNFLRKSIIVMLVGVPGELLGEVVGNDLPYNFEIFGKYEVVLYFLTLITVSDTMKEHFHCYFRLNSRQWFKYDGLNTPAVSSVFFPSIPNLQETIGFLVYISSGYTTENNFSISEE